MQSDIDLARVARHRFVDTVVDDLLNQVIGARSVRVHTGALSDGLQPGENLDIGCIVTIRHVLLYQLV